MFFSISFHFCAWLGRPISSCLFSLASFQFFIFFIYASFVISQSFLLYINTISMEKPYKKHVVLLDETWKVSHIEENTNHNSHLMCDQNLPSKCWGMGSPVHAWKQQRYPNPCLPLRTLLLTEKGHNGGELFVSLLLPCVSWVDTWNQTAHHHSYEPFSFCNSALG